MKSDEIARALAAIPDRKEEGSGVFTTEIDCRVPECGGKIVREVRHVYRGDPMSAIIDPGYKNQLTSVTKYYCPVCQIMYRGLPTK